MLMATATKKTDTTTKEQGVYSGGNYLGAVDENFSTLDQTEQEAWIKEKYGVDVAGQTWGLGGAPSTNIPTTRPDSISSTCSGGGLPSISAPTVTPAPAYEVSPEQQAWADMVQGNIEQNINDPQGMGEETMDLIKQNLTEDIFAARDEDIRVMTNNMQRRGITNSGFIFENEQKIRSSATKALARSFTDLDIQNEMMKLSQFEAAMGQAAQFLGYLSEQSQLEYAPQLATWQAKQQATLMQWQAKIDMYKMKVQQAYNQQNIKLTSQLNMQMAAQQHVWDVEMAEMQIEASNQQAQAQGMGQLFGTTIGGLFSLI